MPNTNICMQKDGCNTFYVIETKENFPGRKTNTRLCKNLAVVARELKIYYLYDDYGSKNSKNGIKLDEDGKKQLEQMKFMPLDEIIEISGEVYRGVDPGCSNFSMSTGNGYSGKVSAGMRINKMR